MHFSFLPAFIVFFSSLVHCQAPNVSDVSSAGSSATSASSDGIYSGEFSLLLEEYCFFPLSAPKEDTHRLKGNH